MDALSVHALKLRVTHCLRPVYSLEQCVSVCTAQYSDRTNTARSRTVNFYLPPNTCLPLALGTVFWPSKLHVALRGGGAVGTLYVDCRRALPPGRLTMSTGSMSTSHAAHPNTKRLPLRVHHCAQIHSEPQELHVPHWDSSRILRHMRPAPISNPSAGILSMSKLQTSIIMFC